MKGIALLMPEGKAPKGKLSSGSDEPDGDEPDGAPLHDAVDVNTSTASRLTGR